MRVRVCTVIRQRFLSFSSPLKSFFLPRSCVIADSTFTPPLAPSPRQLVPPFQSFFRTCDLGSGHTTMIRFRSLLETATVKGRGGEYTGVSVLVCHCCFADFFGVGSFISFAFILSFCLFMVQGSRRLTRRIFDSCHHRRTRI